MNLTLVKVTFLFSIQVFLEKMLQKYSHVIGVNTATTDEFSGMALNKKKDITGLRKSTGGRETSWLFKVTSITEELNKGSTEKQLQLSGQSGT